MKMTKKKDLGIAVIGAGHMGFLHASIAAAHPAVKFLAIADLDAARARETGAKVGAQFTSGDVAQVLARPEIDAVIVATTETQHMRPVLQSLEAGKHVLSETPFAYRLDEVDRMVAAAAAARTELHICYEMRFKRQYHLAKEQIVQGRLGKILGGHGRLYNSRVQGFRNLRHAPGITLSINILTYYVDLVCWFLDGNPPVEVVARGQWGIYKAAGFNEHDVTWALITFADGAVVSLGIDYAFPEKYPSMGQSPRLEILGDAGVMLLDEDHKEQLLYTDAGIPHGLIEGNERNMAFMGTSSPGDWAQGTFWGPLADETRAWLDHHSTGLPCVIATPQEAKRNFEVTLAIDQAVHSKSVIRLPLERLAPAVAA